VNVSCASVLALLFALVTGCTSRERSGDEFRHIVVQTNQNSAGSWWYAGEDHSHRYFVYRLGTQTELYKVKLTEIRLTKIAPQPHALNPQRWINLKEGDLYFPGSTSPVE